MRKNLQAEENYTRLYLIRHGHLINSYQGVYNGQRDIGLSLKGVAQTIAIADWLKDKPIRAIYSSDLSRAWDGAKIIAASLRLEVVPVKAFRERDFGLWEGLTAEKIQSNYEETWAKWIADPVGTRPPKGESIKDMQDRILTKLKEIIEQHRGEEIILFAHAGVNRIILCHALNLPVINWFRIQQDFCGINVMDFHEAAAVVRLMNWTPGYTSSGNST